MALHANSPTGMPHPLAEAGLLPHADLPYDDELARKLAFVAKAFARRGLTGNVEPVVASPRRFGARARAKFRGGAAGELGFYRPGTHEFVSPSIEDLVRPEIVRAAGLLGPARGEIELRSDGARVVAEAEHDIGGIDDLAVAGRVVRGNPALVIDGQRVSPGAFSQVNLEVNRLLVQAVDAQLERLEPQALLDLYGGIGNLCLRAARRGVPTTLVESSRVALADAAFNLAGTVAKVVGADAGRIKPGQYIFDVVVMDPPRAGAQGVLTMLAVTRPRAIVYVSCDPVTLARDVDSIRSGYDIVTITPFDMFPGADHVETLCVLERRKSAGTKRR